MCANTHDDNDVQTPLSPDAFALYVSEEHLSNSRPGTHTIFTSYPLHNPRSRFLPLKTRRRLRRFAAALLLNDHEQHPSLSLSLSLCVSYSSSSCHACFAPDTEDTRNEESSPSTLKLLRNGLSLGST